MSIFFQSAPTVPPSGAGGRCHARVHNVNTRIIHGNALDLPLEDSSVDLVITSPPYFALRSYRDGDEHYGGQVGSEATPQEFLEALWAATAEMVRVLKPTGSCWVNLGDKYAGSGGNNNGMGASTLNHGKGGAKYEAGVNTPPDKPRSYNQNAAGIPAKSLMLLPQRYAIGCVDQLGLILRAEVVWSKPNGLPESVTDRVRRSHEQWFHFVRSPRYFSAVDEIREAHTVAPHAPGNHKWAGERNDGDRMAEVWGNPLGKLPGSVWVIPTEPLIVPEHLGLPDHFAAFPQEWPRRIILGWSPAGICTACGEGRRPVVEKTLSNVWHDKPDDDSRYLGERDAHRHNLDGVKTTFGSTEATITGYACACDVAIAATTPAVILDPFCGTGTVPMVARVLGRTGIGVDLSRDYCRLAEWRVFSSGHGAKAEDRTWAERQGTLL